MQNTFFPQYEKQANLSLSRTALPSESKVRVKNYDSNITISWLFFDYNVVYFVFENKV